MIEGYTPDSKTVSGIMGEESIEKTVFYSRNQYKLTITFTDAKGKDVVNPVIMWLEAGEQYNVKVPEVEGYSPYRKVVKGTMPAKDKEINVNMEAGDLEIPDDPTPLGINNAALGSGEIIE